MSWKHNEAISFVLLQHLALFALLGQTELENICITDWFIYSPKSESVPSDTSLSEKANSSRSVLSAHAALKEDTSEEQYTLTLIKLHPNHPPSVKIR